MKRTKVVRRSRLKRSTKPIPKRGKSRFPKRRDPAFLNWMSEHCCVICGHPGCDPAHLKSRGAAGDDVGNVVPLCRKHHTEQHAMGWPAFRFVYARVNFDLEARYLAAAWNAG